ncbi:hypothetical protein Val02_23870 [Virgisporangium aliadipatigenens]|uniref:Tetratricopeptide repeat protein n=1 Tax=Virgisporangium aliadipatigenens TaxID=741659 RepID=A0A8J3YKC3_9ACTN|nr:tetratricopeptide repeat protein [Virgisporangium aliadipatigenens]GIJ45501.1 hypothetical protein Val02_23870 [Virgisporangium aliadipatigenens]
MTERLTRTVVLSVVGGSGRLIDRIEALRAAPHEAWERPDELPATLRTVADELAGHGRPDLALLGYTELLPLYRQLVAAHPQLYRQSLASALTAAVRLLVQREQWAEALPLAEEAAEAWLGLVDTVDHAADSAADAAWRRTDLCGRLGRHEEALASAAAEVAQAQARPERSTGKEKALAIAHARGHYADRLAAVGRYEEALEISTDNLRYHRTRSTPAANAATLVALEIFAHGRRLAACRRYDEAFEAYTETVAVIRDDAPEHGSGRHDVGAVLNNVAGRLVELGRHREALAAAEEAVAIMRDEVATARAKYRRNEARLRRPDDDESADWLPRDWPSLRRMWRRARRGPELDLCRILNTFGMRLHAVGRDDEALRALTEAVDLAHGNLTDDPPAVGPVLAVLLNNRSIVLSALDRPEPAVQDARRAVPLAGAGPIQAHTRTNLAIALSTMNRHAAALEATSAAVELLRRFFHAEPDLEGELADALAEHSRVRSRRGEHDRAREAADEAVARFRRLAGRDPARYGDDLARALVLSAEAWAAAGEPERARTDAAEATELYRPRAAEYPERYARHLGRAGAVA